MEVSSRRTTKNGLVVDVCSIYARVVWESAYWKSAVIAQRSFPVLRRRTFHLTDFDQHSLALTFGVAKEVSREQAESKKQQAAEFMERLGEPDRAAEFDDMSVDQYADHRCLRITNPRRSQKSRTMANGTTINKAVLQDQIDRAISTLEDAYTPGINREDMAEAVGNALDILKGEDEDDDLNDDDDDNSEEFVDED